MTAEHLDDGMVQSLLHDEAREARDVALRAHLDACADCRDRVAVAQREEADLFKSLETLDVPLPRVNVSELRVRALGGTPAGGRRTVWRWAAGILLVIGLSGVAYAAPGSPLRSAIARIAEWMRPTSATPVRAQITPTPAVAGGVLMDPGNGVVIELRSLQPFDSLVVFLGDEQQVAVRAHGGAVTFVSDVSRLSISNASGVARIEVAIPRAAPRVEIVSGGRPLFVKVGNAITSAATDTTDGRHVIVPTRR